MSENDTDRPAESEPAEQSVPSEPPETSEASKPSEPSGETAERANDTKSGLSRDERERLADQNEPETTSSDGIADVSNFVPDRDEKGELLPARGETPTMGTIMARPLTLGAVKKYFPGASEGEPTESEVRQARAKQRGQNDTDRMATADDIDGSGGDLDDMSDEDVAELIDQFVVEPNLVAEARKLQDRLRTHSRRPDSETQMVWVGDDNEDHLHKNFLDEMNPLAQRDLIVGIIDASGLGDQFDIQLSEDVDDKQTVQVGSDGGN